MELAVEKVKLLIVEDDVDQRELMREILEEQYGVDSVVGVSNRQEALQLDLAGFNLILTDYNLPDCNGMELLEEIKKRCSTPVIMVTGENVGQIAVEAIRKGAADYVVKVGDYLFTIPLMVEKNLTAAKVRRENECLRQELESTLWELREKNTQLVDSMKRLEEMAATDPLTHLYNRRHFGRVIERLFAEASRYDKDISCIMIDLDGYKQLNDTYGHQVGDQLLVLVGKVLSANMRKMDVAARYGGDEFVLLLPHASIEEAAQVGERIREEFRRVSATLLRRNQGVNMSMGVGALKQNRPATADHLVAMADAALYQAKEAGRNRIALSNGTPAEPMVHEVIES